MSIILNTKRIGIFTSSEIWKLTKEGRKAGEFGAPALTYIKEKRFERKLKRSINTEATSRPIIWGKFLESRVHSLLSLSYKYVFDETIKHPNFDFWSGSPDLINEEEDLVADIKCPQPKAFCELIESCNEGKESLKENSPEYYFQLVSNAILTNKKFAELIIYMPYESELDEIREEAATIDTAEPWKYRFIAEVDKSELAYLPDNSDYKNLNVFRFEVTEEDKQFLTDKVIKANQLINL